VNVEGIHVAGVGLHLPPAVPAAEAVARGDVEEQLVRRTRMRSICQSDDEAGPEMAVHAARQALASAGAQPEDVSFVVHAASYFQGHDMWAPATYVQRFAVGNDCLAVDVRQLSNGGMAALEVAAAYLRADPAHREALVTTGDRFCPPGFDRWRTDPGTVLGDGATALVLSRRAGFARLRSLVTVSDPVLEAMGRGADGFWDAPLQARTPISVEGHRRHVTRELGMSELLERLQRGQSRAFHDALDQAGVKSSDIDRFLLPHLGHPRMQFQFFEALDLDPALSTWDWGSTVGHLGAGDQAASLAHLARTGALEPGQCLALVGAGGGFSWTVGVLEITHAVR
jgi:3-oxoacyl-[acyl-carrier-protein] synthase-3